jgi:hypothetical protein
VERLVCPIRQKPYESKTGYGKSQMVI